MIDCNKFETDVMSSLWPRLVTVECSQGWFEPPSPSDYNSTLLRSINNNTNSRKPPELCLCSTDETEPPSTASAFPSAWDISKCGILYFLNVFHIIRLVIGNVP
mmetsp:Transcript_12784/g.17453  ORF Transcript_12784/g.17453 Transcript_12784/m.17453 type:complete len:104 (+) Transcript_12784:552-863(+)